MVWVGAEGPAWMQGGSYLVARRIRIDAASTGTDRRSTIQEQVVGRHKLSGAPLGGKAEFDPPDFDAVDRRRQPGDPRGRACPASARMKPTAARRSCGAAYSTTTTAPASSPSAGRRGARAWRTTRACSSWPIRRDPRTGFIRIFERMAKLDAMNQFTTHVGSGLFAIPPGAAEGGFVGQGLFTA